METLPDNLNHGTTQILEGVMQPDYTDPYVFFVPKSKYSKAEAWHLCGQAGKVLGIPRHAWGKNHSEDHWGYRTFSAEKIKRIEKHLDMEKA